MRAFPEDCRAFYTRFGGVSDTNNIKFIKSETSSGSGGGGSVCPSL